MLLVDAGNLLFKNPPAKAANNKPLIIAQGIATAYGLMGYDAIGLSHMDLMAGKEFFAKEEIGLLPWVSANVSDSQGNPVFAPGLIKDTGNIRVGIIGLTDKPATALADYVVTDWKQGLARQLAEFTGKCELIVVLSTMNSKANRVISEEFPEVDIVITSSRGRAVPAHLQKGTVYSQSSDKGRSLGMLKIHWFKESPITFSSTQLAIKPTSKPLEVLAIVEQIKKSI